MPFTQEAKLTALAIVSIFETSRPLSDYAAYAVLDDGAGVSYGICQFTHRSGALRQVIEKYFELGGQVARTTLELAMPWLMKKTPYAIKRLATSDQFRSALEAASATGEMKLAQASVAADRYLRPAVEACSRRGFTEPLSLAVIYDSIVHGGFERIAAHLGSDPVTGSTHPIAAEHAWITEYVRHRHAWLRSVPRLKATSYRTKFFLDQIAIGNWDLTPPMNVHGYPLTASVLRTTDTPATAPPGPHPPSGAPVQDSAAPVTASTPITDPLATATERFDRIDNAVTTITDRTDRAKSLWTTVIGSASQAGWAVFGWLAGLPREVWIVVAIIAAMLMLLYLYRQIALGKLREAAHKNGTTDAPG